MQDRAHPYEFTSVPRRGLLSAALKTKGLAETDGCFELSVGNPDKGLLPLDEIKRRVAQFVEQGLPLVVTQVQCLPHDNIQHRGCHTEVRNHCSAWEPCNAQAPGAHIRIAVLAACMNMHSYSQIGAAAFMLRQALMRSCSFMQAPLFTIKSKLFAKSTFVIGYDTAIRLIMPKYYGSEAKMLLELAAMRYRWAAYVVTLGRSLLESALAP